MDSSVAWMSSRLEHSLMSVEHTDERIAGAGEHCESLDASMIEQLMVTNTCSYILLQSGHVLWWYAMCSPSFFLHRFVSFRYVTSFIVRVELFLKCST